jgi:Tol biopolymer transport system component
VKLTSDPDYKAKYTSPAWSPDGRSVAMLRATFGGDAAELSVAPADGSSPPHVVGDVSTLASTPRYSPDGSLILLGGAYHNDDAIELVDPATGATRAIGVGSVPTWSPDGRSIAFLRRGELWVMRADGGDPRRLLEGRVTLSDQAWSPDGKRIAVSDISTGTWGPAFVVRVDGSGVRKIEGGWGEVAWSPVADELALASETPRDVGLVAYDLATATERTLTRHPPGWDNSLHWTVDGRAIVYSGAWRELQRVDLATGAIHQLVQACGLDDSAPSSAVCGGMDFEGISALADEHRGPVHLRLEPEGRVRPCAGCFGTVVHSWLSDAAADRLRGARLTLSSVPAGLLTFRGSTLVSQFLGNARLYLQPTRALLRSHRKTVLLRVEVRTTEGELLAVARVRLGVKTA